MMRKYKTAIAVIVVVLAMTANAFGEPGCDFKGKGDKGKKARENITRELNLTADQDKRLTEERTASREAMTALFSSLKEKKNELKDALAKPDVTRQQVEPIMAEIKRLQANMVDKRVDGIFKVKEILTPEQFAKLETLKEKRMEAVNKRRGGKGR